MIGVELCTKTFEKDLVVQKLFCHVGILFIIFQSVRRRAILEVRGTGGGLRLLNPAEFANDGTLKSPTNMTSILKSEKLSLHSAS